MVNSPKSISIPSDNLDLKNISPINVPKSPIRQEILGRNKNIDILSNNHDECLKVTWSCLWCNHGYWSSSNNCNSSSIWFNRCN